MGISSLHVIRVALCTGVIVYHILEFKNRLYRDVNAWKLLTRPRARRSRVWFPVGAEDISRIQNVQTDSSDHTASFSMGAGSSFRKKKSLVH
jgi:hypothetical protein